MGARWEQTGSGLLWIAPSGRKWSARQDVIGGYWYLYCNGEQVKSHGRVRRRLWWRHAGPATFEAEFREEKRAALKEPGNG